MSSGSRSFARCRSPRCSQRLPALALGFANELRFISRTGQVAFSGVIAAGLAEGLAPVFFAFGCLTLTWLCVTIGLSRHP